MNAGFIRDIWLYKVLTKKDGAEFGPKQGIYTIIHAIKEWLQRGGWKNIRADVEESAFICCACKRDTVIAIMNSQLFCLLALGLHTEYSEQPAFKTEGCHRMMLLTDEIVADSRLWKYGKHCIKFCSSFDPTRLCWLIPKSWLHIDLTLLLEYKMKQKLWIWKRYL